MIAVVALVVLGGIVGLDAVSFPQFMLSRPLVAAPLAGAILGDPLSGMWVGVLLELLTLQQLPVGAVRVWDLGPAAVAGAAAAAAVPGGAVQTNLLGLGLACLVGWAGGWTVHGLRHLNGALVGSLGGSPVTAGRVARRHLLAMGLDFVRAAALTGAGIWLGRLAMGALAAGPVALLGFGYVLVAAAVLGLAGGIRVLVMGRPTWIAFAVGGVVGLGVSLWLG